MNLKSEKLKSRYYAAIEDVNSNPTVLPGIKLKITTFDSNYSGFMGIMEGNHIVICFLG